METAVSLLVRVHKGRNTTTTKWTRILCFCHWILFQSYQLYSSWLEQCFAPLVIQMKIRNVSSNMNDSKKAFRAFFSGFQGNSFAQSKWNLNSKLESSKDDQAYLSSSWETQTYGTLPMNWLLERKSIKAIQGQLVRLEVHQEETEVFTWIPRRNLSMSFFLVILHYSYLWM